MTALRSPRLPPSLPPGMSIRASRNSSACMCSARLGSSSRAPIRYRIRDSSLPPRVPVSPSWWCVAMTEFEGLENFDRAQNGLVPIRAETWECFVFINLDNHAAPLAASLAGLVQRIAPLAVSQLHYFDRRTYHIHCNWKVFVDNYLDGGYHVPHLHKGLNSVLDYKQYTIENEDRYCLQSSPMVASDEDASTGAVRKGDRAWYFWQHPNLMINCYEGYMDTNLVVPVVVDHCHVIFDFYFGDISDARRDYNEQSVNVGNRVQEEDLDIFEDVQRGLKSRAYRAGRLSVRREAGEQLFHRLLAADLKRGPEPSFAAAD